MENFADMPAWVSLFINSEWLQDVSKYVVCGSIALWITNGKLNKVTKTSRELIEEAREFLNQARKDVTGVIKEVKDEVYELKVGVVKLEVGVKTLAKAMTTNHEVHATELQRVDERLTRHSEVQKDLLNRLITIDNILNRQSTRMLTIENKVGIQPEQ